MAGLEYVGELSIGALCPLAVSATASIITALQGKLAGLLQLQTQLTVTPPTLAANLALVQQLVAALTAAIAVGLPGVDFQLAAVAALIASLGAQLELLVQLQGLFATAGIFVYSYAGSGVAFGPALFAALGEEWPDGTPGSAQAYAIVLGATGAAAIAGLQAFFGGAG